MKTINSELLQKFLRLAGDRLSGNWVILGGTVLLLKGLNYRVTNDIDLSGPKTATQEQLIILFGIAQELGLPVESINQAGSFFLHKIKNWKNHVIKVHSGKKATFFCPTAFLFIRLKMQRLSETDLSDCLKILEKEELSAPEKKTLLRELDRLSKSGANSDYMQRAAKLRNAIHISPTSE